MIAMIVLGIASHSGCFLVGTTGRRFASRQQTTCCALRRRCWRSGRRWGTRKPRHALPSGRGTSTLMMTTMMTRTGAGEGSETPTSGGGRRRRAAPRPPPSSRPSRCQLRGHAHCVLFCSVLNGMVPVAHVSCDHVDPPLPSPRDDCLRDAKLLLSTDFMWRIRWISLMRSCSSHGSESGRSTSSAKRWARRCLNPAVANNRDM